MLKKIAHIYQTKIDNLELRSLLYVGWHENILILLSLKHFKNNCFTLYNKMVLFYAELTLNNNPV